MQPRFKLRHAVVGYIVALVFAFNGLLTSVIDASIASGGSSFALITCLGGQVPGQPGQSDHASKCSCSLSSCCCAGALARNADGTEVDYPVASAAVLQRTPNLIERDFRADHPLHLRSPPDELLEA
jgi:hypothetical protein